MSSMRQLVVSASVCLSLGVSSALAADWIYSGDPDIAIGIVGHENDKVTFEYFGTNTLSSDVSIGQVQVKRPGTSAKTEQVFDFRDGNHKVTLGQNLVIGNDRVTLRFLGGVWNLGWYMFNNAKDASNGGWFNDIRIDAGCIWTNAVFASGAPIFAKAAANARFRVCGASKIYGNVSHKLDSNTGKKLFIFDNVDQGGRLATNMYFEVSGGSYLNVDNLYVQDTTKSGSIVDRDLDRGNRALLKGAGTLVETASVYIGDGSSGSRLDIDDGAKLYTKNVYGSSTAELRECPVTVSNGGLFVVDGGHFYVGKETYGGLKFRAVDGGIIQAGQANAGKLDIYFNSPDNAIIVSNGTLKCARINLGYTAAADRNKVVFAGPSAAMTIDTSLAGSSPQTFFGVGSDNVFEVASGAQVTYPNLVTKLSSKWCDGTGNELRVTGAGSSLTLPQNMVVTNDIGNTVRVADGGTLVFSGEFSFGGTNNSLVVDNGTVSCVQSTYSGGGSDYASIQIGGSLGCYGDNIGVVQASSNATVVLRGDHPQISIPSTAIRFANDSVLRFELPPNGYQSGVVPMDISYFAEGKRSNGARGLRIEIDGLETLQSNLTARTDITLMRCSRGCKEYGAVAEANTALPKGCSLAWQNGATGTEKLLVLSAKPAGKGLVLIFR